MVQGIPPAASGDPRWPVVAAKIAHLVSIVVLLAFMTVALVGARQDPDLHPVWGIATVVLIVGYSTLGRLIVVRARNRIGWVLLAIAAIAATALPAEQYVLASYTASTDPTLPLTGAAAWLANLGPGLVAAAIPVLLLVFPTGSLPGRRWRWVARLWTIGAIASATWLALRPGEILGEEGRFAVANPIGVTALRPFGDVLVTVGLGSLLAVTTLSIASLVGRFRRAGGEERQQLKWLMLVAACALVVFLAMVVTEPLETRGTIPEISDALWPLFVAMLAIGVPIAVAIAVLKYRLYDIDLVIRKSLVFASLALFITVVYAAIVGGLGAVIGERASTELSFAAAAVLALVFQPARERARRVADRLVYGERATPYEAMSAFSERIGETYATEDILPRMASIVATSTGASAAAVWLLVAGELRRVASWPDDGTEIDGQPHEFELRHQGELLGAITVTMPANDPMDPAKERLVRDLGAQAGLVLRNVRLVAELRASRQRLVVAQDEERRRIERNLHDGAQQHLVALAVQLRLAEQMVGRDPAKEREMIHRVQSAANDALEELRDLARGIYPPLLADKGLAAALEAHARRLPLSVTLESDGVARYPREIESALYFCSLEALTNVVKYANASTVTVTLRRHDHGLSVTVADDGSGFDPETTAEGTGLRGMTDRLEAIGGHLEVSSSIGRGTTVVATVRTERSA